MRNAAGAAGEVQVRLGDDGPQAVERHVLGGRLELAGLLEGDDPAQRDEKAEIQRLAREVRAASLLALSLFVLVPATAQAGKYDKDYAAYARDIIPSGQIGEVPVLAPLGLPMNRYPT